MKGKRLKFGYTTGACAAAAAKGAALMLRDGIIVAEVEITLPGGVNAGFRLHGQELGKNSAACFVIKDAGDDPDVTNGAEVHAKVSLERISPSPLPSPARGEGDFAIGSTSSIGAGEQKIIIEGGTGIGRVTKPGLAVRVGEWAINPVPRRMIEEAVCGVFASHPSPFTPRVRITIPNGEELAKKTLNSRLGIIGGLSILGTTGIVKPVSAQAWTDTIDTAIDVALACGSKTLVLSTGRTSEQTAQRFLSRHAENLLPFGLCPLPAESFIMMGDHAGYAIRACSRKRVRKVIIAGQFAKLLKIACGHEQTHVSSSRLDLKMLKEWLEMTPSASHLAPHASQANTAREILERSGSAPALASLVCDRVAGFAGSLAPGMNIKVLLAGYGGEVLYYGPKPD